MKKFLLLCSAVVLTFSISWAQERTVSGRVTSAEDGTALPGVNVVVKGTTNGTVTDAEGNYKLSVPSAQSSLVFSFIGLKTSEVIIGERSVVDVALSLDVTQLSEVVVTAFGIEKEKKALGYAVTTIGGGQIAQNPETDISRVLRGKAPGVNITQTSGVSGSATNIIIRGYTSVTSSNQPLFIVDGVPFDGSTNYSNNFEDGQNESSRFLDIDPNNIESVNVLKGLNATVLYGDRGRNGVIVITTKNNSKSKVNKKNEVTFTGSYFVNEIASMPDRTKKFGNGFQRAYGPFFSNWGPAFSELSVVPHPYGRANLADDFPEFQGQTYQYKYYDIDNFFRKGTTYNGALNVRGGNENLNYSVNYAHLDETGFTRGNDMQRDNFGFGGQANLSNKFTVSTSFNFVRTQRKAPPVASSLGSGTTGSSASVFGDVFYTPTSIDLMGLPYESPLDNRSVYYRGGNDIQNPRWTLANSKTGETINRFFGNMAATYKFNDWISLLYRFGLDTYTQDKFNGQNKGGVDGNINGFYETTSAKNTIYNHDIVLTLNKDINEDFGFNGIVGYQARRDEYSEVSTSSNNQISFGLLAHYNFTDYSANQFINEENRLGLYASTTFDYKNYLFLNLSGRNDWSNTVEQANNSIFYPGASLAFDATSAIDALANSNALSYLKLRVGYGSSANFPSAYSTRNQLNLTSRSFVTREGEVIVTNAVDKRLGNPDLKPSRVSEIELGFESKFLDDKISLDVSVFKKNTQDLIIDQDLDPSTGTIVKRTNAGELEVKGIEISYSANVLSLGNFKWAVNGNFNALRNTVVDLPDGTTRIGIEGYSNLGNFAIEGQPYGVIMGSFIERDANGNKRVNSEGEYIISNDIKVIGNPNPDWQTALTNSFSYKGFRLNVEWQYTHGGDIYSRTASNLVGRGVTTETDGTNRQTYVLPGVLNDGSPNNIQITPTDMYFNVLGFGADELKVWDGSNIRLNEVSLSYQLPASVLSKTPFGSVSITASGTNLWYKAINFPDAINFDPNVIGTGVGNGQGIDFLNGPSVRRYGISLRATF